MSEITGSRVKVGDELPSLSRAVSQDLMNDYTFTLGIGNPIHHDAEFAARSEFGGPIASGPIALALLDDALTSAYPAEWPRSGSIDAAFLRPVRPGDTVVTQIKVSGVEEEAVGRLLILEATCLNQDGYPVVAGTARLQLPTA